MLFIKLYFNYFVLISGGVNESKVEICIKKTEGIKVWGVDFRYLIVSLSVLYLYIQTKIVGILHNIIVEVGNP